jgi:hypothetical protein
MQMLGIDQQSGSKRPVVLVGPFEHHSNLLPWRESRAKVVSIRDLAASSSKSSASTRNHNACVGSVQVIEPDWHSCCSRLRLPAHQHVQSSYLLDSTSLFVHVRVLLPVTTQAGVDMQHLEQVLQKYSSSGRRVIGAFSAVSNITGLASDMDAITGLSDIVSCGACNACSPELHVSSLYICSTATSLWSSSCLGLRCSCSTCHDQHAPWRAWPRASRQGKTCHLQDGLDDDSLKHCNPIPDHTHAYSLPC